jgi:hypothetical protein
VFYGHEEVDRLKNKNSPKQNVSNKRGEKKKSTNERKLGEGR